MTDIKRIFQLLLIIILFFATSTGAANDIDIYLEGVIRDSELTVYAYADIHVENVISYGIRISYNPDWYTLVSAAKSVSPAPYTANPSQWHIGTPAASCSHLPAPDTSVPGEIIIIGGKLDPGHPGNGMAAGSKIFLGMATFTPYDGGFPSAPLMTVTFARADPYVNFARIRKADGGWVQNLDDNAVSFRSVTICQAGDANGDGTISPPDITAVKANIGNPNAPCYVDCVGGGHITPNNIMCVRYKIAQGLMQ